MYILIHKYHNCFEGVTRDPKNQKTPPEEVEKTDPSPKIPCEKIPKKTRNLTTGEGRLMIATRYFICNIFFNIFSFKAYQYLC